MKASSQIVYVDLDKVHANQYNPNVMSKEKFEALVDFCRGHGADQLDPIWVRHDGVDKYEVIDGEHRLKAAKEVGWKRLRAFVIDMEVDDAKAFNVRKNRERGQIDVFKLGRIFIAERQAGATIEDIATKYGYFTKNGSSGDISNIIACVEHEKQIREKLCVDASTRISFYKARNILRELKREERGQNTDSVSAMDVEDPFESQQLTRFLTRYAKALRKNPLPQVQTGEVETAIDFFKRLLEKKQINCPICGEKHLQWRCGHDF